MAFLKDDDCLLVGRDKKDYRISVKNFAEEVGGGGGGGLDEILNAPLVKGPVYLPHHEVEGESIPMILVDGDGKNGSTFNAPGMQYLNGIIQYKSSMNTAAASASTCAAQVSDLKVTVDHVEDGNGIPGYKPGDIFCDGLSGGRIHSHGTERAGYKLKCEFTNCNGDTDVLFITCSNYTYRSMRREDIDLREMIALDEQIKKGTKSTNKGGSK